jgi:vacuolar protein-sorting-associated protein 4
MEQYLTKAKTHATRALESEEAGDTLVAYRSYIMALEHLEYTRKWYGKDSARLQTMIRSLMEPMLERAEDLLKELQKERPPLMDLQQQPATTAVDAETLALQQALAGAVITERPATRLVDVAGLADVKQALREAVIFPVEAPQLYESTQSWAGILLYGPPGTGKTHIARAIAGESGCTFYSVSAADLVNKYVGESERLIKALFGLARTTRPAIIFIDEVESIVPVRGEHSGHQDRAVAEFLKQIDGITGVDNHGVLVLAATNLPESIDPAALRRFERRIYVPMPDAHARTQMIANAMLKTDPTVEQMALMIERTDGYSGADIKVVLKEVEMRVLRSATSEALAYCASPTERGAFIPCPVDAPGAIACKYEDWPDKKQLRSPAAKPEFFLEALDVVKPAVSADKMFRYADWAQQYK